ncbi:MAG: MaoC/PaaZ C-terminal domain-containing protein [Gordonia amarae]
MPINPDIAIGADIGEDSYSWSASDVALYNLAVGGAADPMDETGLGYIHDSDPKVLPSFATVAPTFHVTEAPKVVFPGIDIDLAKVVHAGQQVTIHRPIPAAGKATTRGRIAEVWDKGSAAVIVQEYATVDDAGELLWTTRSSIFASGEGGFGGERGTSDKVTLPDRAPDHHIEIPTLPQQALFYRLCGDRNPLHSDPVFAQKAGFPHPILHGRCTYGAVLRAIIDEVHRGDVSKVTDFSATFAGVVFPGETLVVDVWDEGRLLAVASVAERPDAVVLKNIVCASA